MKYMVKPYAVLISLQSVNKHYTLLSVVTLFEVHHFDTIPMWVFQHTVTQSSLAVSDTPRN